MFAKKDATVLSTFGLAHIPETGSFDTSHLQSLMPKRKSVLKFPGVVGVNFTNNVFLELASMCQTGVSFVTSIIGLIYGIITLVACVACIALGTAAIKEGYDSLTPEEKQQIEQGLNQAVNEINNSSNVTEVQ